VLKKDLIEDFKIELDELELDEEEDLNSSIWIPIITDATSKQPKDGSSLSDPNVKEMDLAEISEKEVFVRKADLVNYY
jgi:hypothetical protein